jgi:hypothetical protein
MNLPIPRSLDELTPTWLTSALTESGILKGANVQRVDSEVLGTGFGFMGEILRLKLTYDEIEPGVPVSLIAKIPTSDKKIRSLALLGGLYENEIGFYESIGKKMNIGVPRCYYSAMSKIGIGKDKRIERFEGGKNAPLWLAAGFSFMLRFFLRFSRKRFILLLEDLSHLRLGDQVDSCTINEAHRVLTTIAKVHAQFWNSEELNELDFVMPMDVGAEATQKVFQKYALDNQSGLSGRLSDRNLLQLNWLGGNSAALLRVLSASSVTLVHNDFRLDNLFFSDDDDEIVLFDWQRPSIGAPGYDVAYFLSAINLEKLGLTDVRPLLDHYYSALLEQGVKDYTRERLQWEYGASSLLVLQLLVSSVLGKGFDSGEGRGSDLKSLWLQRLSVQLDSVDCEKILVAGGKTAPGTIENL